MRLLALLGGLVRRRTEAARWPYLFPALVSLLFVGHAYEDGGWDGARFYLALILASAAGLFWPTILGWALLFFLFLAYGIFVAVGPVSAPAEERFVFLALGLGPALALWLGRPWRRLGPNQRGQSDEEGRAHASE